MQILALYQKEEIRDGVGFEIFIPPSSTVKLIKYLIYVTLLVSFFKYK